MPIGHGSSVHGEAVRQWRCKPSDGLQGDSDGLEKPGATVVLQPECVARRRAREDLAASAQNRHPSYQDLASGSKLVKIEDWAKLGPESPQNKVSRFLTSKPGKVSGLLATWRTSKRGGETEDDQDIIVVVRLYRLHVGPSGHL